MEATFVDALFMRALPGVAGEGLDRLRRSGETRQFRADHCRSNRGSPAMKRLLREPLVHFLLLGAILFGAYAYAERPHGGIELSTQIRLTIDDISQLVLVFRSQWRRNPTPDELRLLVEDRVREEVLYREAIALGLDKEDTIVRRRMAQKVQFLIEDAARAPTREELETWYQANRDRFALPSRVSFRHLYFSPDRRGARAHDDAATALTKLAGQPEDFKSRGWPRRCVHVPGVLPRPRIGLSGQGVRSEFRACRCEAVAGVMAGTDRIRIWLASRVHRHADPRPRTCIRGGRGRR